MTQIRVQLDTPRDRSYTIDIRPGLLTALPGMLARQARRARLFVITDATVARLYGRAMFRELVRAGADVRFLVVPAGERSKNVAVAHGLQSRLLRGGVRRDSIVVALGGGVVGDLAGYVAATVLRGVRYVQIPTTLLAQVDSSVGGKVGVDHSAGKNLIGAFHQPTAVYIDPLVLRTLPRAEFRNGLAEVVKIAAALDREFFAFIERNVRKLVRTRVRLLTDLIAHAVGLKAAVVEEDEFESGLRKSLNVGHTIGHALEASTRYSLKHGEGVAIGMAAEARVAVALGVLPKDDANRLLRTMRAIGLPTSVPRRVKPAVFASSLALDKKSDAGGTTYVLLRSIGRCAIGVPVPDALIRRTLGIGSRRGGRTE